MVDTTQVKNVLKEFFKIEEVVYKDCVKLRDPLADKLAVILRKLQLV